MAQQQGGEIRRMSSRKVFGKAFIQSRVLTNKNVGKSQFALAFAFVDIITFRRSFFTVFSSRSGIATPTEISKELDDPCE